MVCRGTRLSAVLVAMVLASACLGDDAATPDGGGGVGFASEIAPILSARCGDSCHLARNGGNTGLDLHPDVAWSALVGVGAWPCGLSRPQLLVDPGQPETSMLWRRLSGVVATTELGCGWMPADRYAPLAELEPDDFHRIEQWIREGALNN